MNTTVFLFLVLCVLVALARLPKAWQTPALLGLVAAVWGLAVVYGGP